MADSGDLRRLFGALKSTASPLQRMKLLARGWRTLRTLSPKQRQNLASTVGLEGAEEILERLADRGSRMTPAFLLQTLEKIKSADPRELQETVDGLRDPKRRGKVLERGLNRLTDALAGKDGEAPKKSRAKPVDVATAATAATGAAAASAVAARGTAPTTKPPVDNRPAVVEPAAPKETPRAPIAVATAAETVRPEPPPTAPGDKVETEPAGPTAPVEASTASPGPSLGERVEAAGGLMARFRALRHHLEQARGSSIDELSSLIDRFPPGWARRRALCALLEAGIPGDLHQAIFLVESLGSRTDRRWCVAAILRSFELSDFEKQTLLERHGSFVRTRPTPPRF